MILRDLLELERIVLELDAKTYQEAVSALAEHLIKTGTVADPAELRRLTKNAPVGETIFIGEGVYLPHFRTEAVEGLTVGLGVTREPVEVEIQEDRVKGRIFFLVLAPGASAQVYLQAIASIATAVRTPKGIRAILGADSPKAVLDLPIMQGEGPELPKAGDLMARQFQWIDQDATALEAAERVLTKRIGHLPVINEKGEVLGVIGRKELLQALLPYYLCRMGGDEIELPAALRGRDVRSPAETRVTEIMSRSVLCVDEGASLAEAAQMLINKNIESLPVVKDGVMVGLLRRDDLLEKMVRAERKKD